VQDLEKLDVIVDANDPVLMVYDHDQVFLDYNADLFVDLVNKVFPCQENNFRKALYYSHAPEVISMFINADNPNRAPWRGGEVRSWSLDLEYAVSIWVMTTKTLRYVLSSARLGKSSYMGRIDWPGIEYRKLSLKVHAYPREFFKHFDGYGHVSGMPEEGELFLSQQYPREFPVDYLETSSGAFCDPRLVNFYYMLWSTAFKIPLRDRLLARYIFFLYPKKYHFVQTIEKTLSIFRNSYLLQDADKNFLSEEMVDVVFYSLRRKVYARANNI